VDFRGTAHSDRVAIEQAIDAARCPEDVFGKFDGPIDARVHSITKIYRYMVGFVHPDHGGDPAVFRDLTTWLNRALDKARAGTYGDGKPHVDTPKPPEMAPTIVHGPKRKYVVHGVIAHGDKSDIYRCTFADGSVEHEAAFKLVRSAADNDLANAESETLGRIYPAKQASDGPYRYLPKPIDAFMLRGGKSEPPRRALVMELANGYVTLDAIINGYPAGIDYRDMAWMFKRGLAALSFLHEEKKIVHGAILPTHVMVHPTGHGAKILDWSYAVAPPSPVKAISRAYRDWYAPELLLKRPSSPQLDIYMLATCMVAVLGGNPSTGMIPGKVPAQIRAFLSSLLIKNPARRESDAGKLHEEFDELLRALVGRPVYRPFAMPS
jgi:serine/threonine protein kinase